ncbi:hypothetical protein [Paracoccus chinensis]|uniref:hypothetical protein n=1 Tax=Paracoccus chinensis TaxID=525640 RepID=UPI000B83D502|nr:hypothetical protein [Paracoccus chinensis]
MSNACPVFIAFSMSLTVCSLAVAQEAGPAEPLEPPTVEAALARERALRAEAAAAWPSYADEWSKAFEAGAGDTPWTAEKSAQLTASFKARNLVGFALQRTECRADKCLVVVAVEDGIAADRKESPVNMLPHDRMSALQRWLTEDEPCGFVITGQQYSANLRVLVSCDTQQAASAASE